MAKLLDIRKSDIVISNRQNCEAVMRVCGPKVRAALQRNEEAGHDITRGLSAFLGMLVEHHDIFFSYDAAVKRVEPIVRCNEWRYDEKEFSE
jgi:hypothetical protein